MTWIDRLRPEVSLVAPDGQEFFALWRGNARTLEKKIGVFDYPLVDGAYVQDMGAAAVVYPLTIYFEGGDNDQEAERFFVACKQRGAWSVMHPAKGKISLQLISVVEKIAPIESGNITIFETQWMEPLKDSKQASLSQKAHNINSGVDSLNEVSTSQFVKNAKQGTAPERSAIASGASTVASFVTKHLAPLYEVGGELKAQVDSVYRSIDDSASEAELDLTAMAGEIQNLIELPVLSDVDGVTKVAAYIEMLEELANLSQSDEDAATLVKPAQEVKNAALVQELSIVSCLGALAQSAVYLDPQSKSIAIENIEKLTSAFSDGVAELDQAQMILSKNTINEQYFSQSESYAELFSLVTLAAEYLLLSSYGLNIERRFTLQQARAPIEIVITEQGGLGRDDENFDAFIAANGLKGTDILLLKPGREVVVYA